MNEGITSRGIDSVLLLKLADLLEADADNEKGMKFDIDEVGYTPSLSSVGMNCGTTGCAMGLAAISGEFPGLGYSVSGTGAIRCTVRGSHRFYVDAAMDIFGIDGLTARMLFSPNFYPRDLSKGAEVERMVASRIRLLVDRGRNLVREDFNSATGMVL